MKRAWFAVFIIAYVTRCNLLLAESGDVQCGKNSSYDKDNDACYCDSGYKVSEDKINCVPVEIVKIDERPNIYSYLSDKEKITVVDEYSDGWHSSLDNTCSMNIVSLIASDPVRGGPKAKGLRIEFQGRQTVSNTQFIFASILGGMAWRDARERGYFIKDADDAQKNTFNTLAAPQGQYGSNVALIDYDEIGFLSAAISSMNELLMKKENIDCKIRFCIRDRHVYYITKNGFVIGFDLSGDKYEIFAKNLYSDLLFTMDENYFLKLKSIIDSQFSFLGGAELKRYNEKNN